MLDNLPDQALLLVGVLLMVLGVSFSWKAFQAIIKGRVKYWDGFLPFTLVSPWLLHLPEKKNSLIKWTEGLWVHLIMGPLFMISAILCLCAGADLTTLPGTATLNLIINGGKAGNDAVTFDKHVGYHFPIVARAMPILKKIASGQMGVKNQDKLYTENNESLGQAMNK